MASKIYVQVAILILGMLLCSAFVSAATLQGNIYNSKLELEKNVLVEINTTPQQKYLSKDGTYSFELAPGDYALTARSNEYTVTENIQIISSQGKYVYDLFLLPDFADEDELWQEAGEDTSIENVETFDYRSLLAYLAVGFIIIIALYRLIKARRKYGPLGTFRKRIKEESKKTLEEHKADLEKEPGCIDRAFEIIKKHDGRISQKELRKEMLYLSEGKISLILTELEHKGKIEKIKKGRGNVIILKQETKPENNSPMEPNEENDN